MVPQPESDTSSTPPAHLLVVDDDDAIISLLQTILEPHYRVTATCDSLEALQLLSCQSFDLILTDINMPGVNGFQLLAAARALPAYAETPVVLISGMTETPDVVRGLELGANDYLPKPIDREIVLARLHTQLTLKNLLDAHKQTIEELQSIQVMRDRFFSIASHELKNPMNNIGMAHFLLRGMLDEDPSVDVLLENIELALDAMHNIVSDFLESAAIQKRALEIQIAPVEVEEALWDASMQFSIGAQKKNITLKIEDAAGKVYADHRRLSQALNNLISNAIKYSPRNTTITLSADQTSGFLRILVRDQGPGIPADERHLLFTEFGKLSTEPTEGESRTGLGLWIVKELVTIQGGTVGAIFPDSGGSIFWIKLPAVEEEDETLPVNPFLAEAENQARTGT